MHRLAHQCSSGSDSDCVSRETASSRQKTQGCWRVTSCTFLHATQFLIDLPECNQGTAPTLFEPSVHQSVWFQHRLGSKHRYFCDVDFAVLCEHLNVSDPLGSSAYCKALTIGRINSGFQYRGTMLLCSLGSTARTWSIETAPSPADVPSPRRKNRIHPNSRKPPLAWCWLCGACGKP